MKKHTVIGLGEILWDLLPSGKQLGGAPANFAFHSKQFGANAYVLSSIGDDELGREILDTLRIHSVRSLISTSKDYPTGRVEVTVNTAGNPHYNIVENVAWDHLPFDRKHQPILEEADAICYGSLAQRNDLSRKHILEILENVPKRCLKVFDVNIRRNYFTKEMLHETLLLSDVVKVNQEELKLLQSLFQLSPIEGKALRQIRKLYQLELIILTKGEQGSIMVKGIESSFLPAEKVQVSDTIGAGDSFTATVVMGLLKGYSLAKIHQMAARVSGFVCSQTGAMADLPLETWSEEAPMGFKEY